jgi:hypothetical protein
VLVEPAAEQRVDRRSTLNRRQPDDLAEDEVGDDPWRIARCQVPAEVGVAAGDRGLGHVARGRMESMPNPIC